MYAVQESSVVTSKAENESEAKAIIEHRIKGNRINFYTTLISFEEKR